MAELMTLALLPINLVFTLLLLMVILYWIIVILGVLDVDLFQVDLSDFDADGDLGVDGDVHGAGASLSGSVLHFFHVGEVPVMVLFSLLVLSLWAGSVLGNYYYNPESLPSRAFGILVVNVVVALVVVKALGAPLRPFYAMFNRDYNAPKRVMGSLCQITTTRVTSTDMGQAEIRTKGAPILLNVLSKQDYRFAKGDEAVVVGKDKESGIHYIVPPKLES